MQPGPPGSWAVSQVGGPWQVGDQQARWAGYLDPATGVLRNLVGADTPEQLRLVEDRLVEARSFELEELGLPDRYNVGGFEQVHH